MSVFLVLGVVGLLVLAVSLVAGDLLDGVLDALAGDTFTTAVLGAFVSALGFGGAVAEAAGAPLVVSVPVGVVAGGLFAWAAAWLTRLVRGGGSGEAHSTHDTLGRDASVVQPIPADGYGVVRVVLGGGHVLRLNARADRPDLVVEPGTAVHVVGVLSPTAVTVTPTHPDLELPEPHPPAERNP